MLIIFILTDKICRNFCGRCLCAFFYYMFTEPNRELIRSGDRIPAVTWIGRNTSQGQLTFQYLYSLPPPATEVGRGVYWFHPVRLSICLSTRLSARLSVRPSVCLSVCSPFVDMIFSRHVLRNRYMDFSENLYTDYSTLDKCRPRIFILIG